MSDRDKTFMQFLPAIYSEDETTSDFLPRFLHIFEEIIAGIEQEVDDIPKLFNPWKTPSRFVPWLAKWVALELNENWDERQSRTLIRQIVSLYKIRGTKQALESYLRIYAGSNLRIDELPVDTEPHLFRVTINYPSYDPVSRVRRAREVRAILDREKPAHTHFSLAIDSPTMQIAIHSTIGVDTILGTT